MLTMAFVLAAAVTAHHPVAVPKPAARPIVAEEDGWIHAATHSDGTTYFVRSGHTAWNSDMDCLTIWVLKRERGKRSTVLFGLANRDGQPSYTVIQSGDGKDLDRTPKSRLRWIAIAPGSIAESIAMTAFRDSESHSEGRKSTPTY